MYSDYLNDAIHEAKLNENLFDKTIFSKVDDSKFSQKKDILDAIVEGKNAIEELEELLK